MWRLAEAMKKWGRLGNAGGRACDLPFGPRKDKPGGAIALRPPPAQSLAHQALIRSHGKITAPEGVFHFETGDRPSPQRWEEGNEPGGWGRIPPRCSAGKWPRGRGGDAILATKECGEIRGLISNRNSAVDRNCRPSTGERTSPARAHKLCCDGRWSLKQSKSAGIFSIH